jgi:hypothetical protein
MKKAHIFWSWEWPELDHFFVHPILPKHRSEQFFCFQPDLLHFSHGVSWGYLLKSGRTDFDIRLAISVATAQSGALLGFFDFC